MQDFLINNWPIIVGVCGFFVALAAFLNHSMGIYERISRFIKGSKREDKKTTLKSQPLPVSKNPH